MFKVYKMNEQQVELLRKQIKRLDEKDFDFLNWKSLAIVLLESFFGKNSEKVHQVQKIEFDQSSWTLRDTSGPTAKLDNCKRMGKEILEIAIFELENELKNVPGEGSVTGFIASTLKEELTGKQLRQLKEILSIDEKTEEKMKKLKKQLKELSSENRLNLLVGVLINPQVVKYLD